MHEAQYGDLLLCSLNVLKRQSVAYFMEKNHHNYSRVARCSKLQDLTSFFFFLIIFPLQRSNAQMIEDYQVLLLWIRTRTLIFIEKYQIYCILLSLSLVLLIVMILFVKKKKTICGNIKNLLGRTITTNLGFNNKVDPHNFTNIL